MTVIMYLAQALQILAVSLFVFWAAPSVVLLGLEEFSTTFRNFREMREDNRRNKQRMAQLVRDAEIRWEQRMGVKTNG